MREGILFLSVASTSCTTLPVCPGLTLCSLLVWDEEGNLGSLLKCHLYQSANRTSIKGLKGGIFGVRILH